MQKTAILILAVFATLAGLAIGFAATRSAKLHHAVTEASSGHSYHTGEPALREAAARMGKPREATSHDAASPDDDAPQTGAPDDAIEVVRLASNPQPAPPFLMNDLGGQPISTAEWKGKVVILNFWATWCPPCRAEIPMMIDLQNRYKDQLLVIGVSVDDAPPSEVHDFVKQEGINYPVVMANLELVKEYGGVPALPTAFVINPDGRVVQKHVGLFPETMYDQEIRALLNLPLDARIETFEDHGQIFLKNAALATDLPGVDLKGLTPEQRKIALKELNTRTCECGCRLTLAQCRIVDSPCQVSKRLANEVVKKVESGAPASASPPPAPADTGNPQIPQSAKPGAPTGG